ncbi:MAG: hypothetical protein EXQ69_03300 [Acidimicrobiia bacterium]|nr:hypothetical protein [Acidimicrobiia bacterium]
MADDDVFIDFSQEELVVLARLLGRPEQAYEISKESALTARSSLLARHVLVVSGDNDQIAAPIDLLLATTWDPSLVGRSWRRVGDTLERRTFGGRPEVGVEQFAVEEGIVRLVPFAVEELLVRMLIHAGLAERPTDATDEFSVAWPTLLEATELARTHDPAAGAEVLRASGVVEHGAVSFCLALAHPIAFAGASLLAREEDDKVSGGELAWLDGGDHGLWLIPVEFACELCFDADDPFEEVPETCVVTRVEASTIAAELYAYLPVAPASGE